MSNAGEKGGCRIADIEVESPSACSGLEPSTVDHATVRPDTNVSTLKEINLNGGEAVPWKRKNLQRQFGCETKWPRFRCFVDFAIM